MEEGVESFRILVVHNYHYHNVKIWQLVLNSIIF